MAIQDIDHGFRCARRQRGSSAVEYVLLLASITLAILPCLNNIVSYSDVVLSRAAGSVQFAPGGTNTTHPGGQHGAKCVPVGGSVDPDCLANASHDD